MQNRCRAGLLAVGLVSYNFVADLKVVANLKVVDSSKIRFFELELIIATLLDNTLGHLYCYLCALG